jgi:hypothetical protein
MTPQTTAGAVKPDWTTTEFWRPAKSHAAMAHPEGSTGAAGTAATTPVHLPERILTRCAMTHQSPTW